MRGLLALHGGSFQDSEICQGLGFFFLPILLSLLSQEYGLTDHRKVSLSSFLWAINCTLPLKPILPQRDEVFSNLF